MQDIFMVRPEQVIGLQRNEARIDGYYEPVDFEPLPPTPSTEVGQSQCTTSPVWPYPKPIPETSRLIFIRKQFANNRIEIEQAIRTALGPSTQIIWLDGDPCASVLAL